MLKLPSFHPQKPQSAPPPPKPHQTLTPKSNPLNQFPIPSTASSRLRRPLRLRIRAIDAAQPFDYEALMSLRHETSSKLKIAVVGFGNFGQFLARTIVRQGHTVLAHSRSDHSAAAASLGASFYADPNDLCEAHPDVILLCTSILSTKSVLRSLPLQRLRRNTLFVDVLSVKEFPKDLFLNTLPREFDILCTHPMFGPESGKNGWADLPFVYEKVRVGGHPSRAERIERFLEIFRKEGCRMVEMSCAEHDKHAAETQFITHTVGRILGRLGLQSTPINTRGYETLLDLVENTAGDSFDLYYGLFMYNKNSTDQVDRLDEAFGSLRRELFGKLHVKAREHIFESADGGEEGSEVAHLRALPENGVAAEDPLMKSL
ncbi:hypothetical protein QJS10_CPA05g01404 [Acorus calamus]|uniref:Prephenate/arogenate dehydrogenase domain-containing protein n=1 Tax=Acorus calamus TaxID=4465 RepID=A0AAV9ESS2_ACOCL|nr:hypothetical protein QJS10_CPA05g01404 [Acorus calamus]